MILESFTYAPEQEGLSLYFRHYQHFILLCVVLANDIWLLCVCFLLLFTIWSLEFSGNLRSAAKVSVKLMSWYPWSVDHTWLHVSCGSAVLRAVTEMILDLKLFRVTRSFYTHTCMRVHSHFIFTLLFSCIIELEVKQANQGLIL